MVSYLLKHVFTILDLFVSLADFLGFVWLIVILFLVDKCMMWMLFVVMFVVVRLESIVVSFWCLESVWLCGVWVWPSGVCVL